MPVTPALVVGGLLFCWATGYALGWKVKAIYQALSAV